MEISNEDRELIRKFENIRQRGMYVDSKLLTEVYNRVLNKHVNPTNCGACCRQRTQELYSALLKQEEQERKAAEAAKVLEEENKPETKITKKKK